MARAGRGAPPSRRPEERGADGAVDGNRSAALRRCARGGRLVEASCCLPPYLPSKEASRRHSCQACRALGTRLLTQSHSWALGPRPQDSEGTPCPGLSLAVGPALWPHLPVSTDVLTLEDRWERGRKASPWLLPDLTQDPEAWKGRGLLELPRAPRGLCPLPRPPFALTEVPGHGSFVIWVISFRPWTEAGQVLGCFPQAVHPDPKREVRPCPLSSQGARALERQAAGTHTALSAWGPCPSGLPGPGHSVGPCDLASPGAGATTEP